MKLILTHNHSDFDAVAAQLAAALLFEESYALLSNQLNRNVREYVALYGDELTQLHAELPDNRPDELILVDTDVRPQLPLLGEALLPTTIVDHHPLKRVLASHERLLCEPTGATTTILVRRLAESHVRLSVTEATLLLLGIYEDTGNLSYRGTTRADLICAGWLVGQGGRIDAVREWLASGLSPEQAQVYQQLEQNLRILEIGGRTVMLSAARIEGTVPELALLAQKLRDLYQPAALLLAFQGGENGTQLVLRANSEALDVGELARAYGGGGHAAAAAAYVRGRGAQELLAELNERLPKLIQPTAAAVDVMTQQVHTIAPSASLLEAEEVLTRYGHSALPVVDESGLVRGLIARRDLDRARRHGLHDAPVSRYMWRDPPLVAPDTPITALRRTLAEEDTARVGRLLVVDERRHLLGIITRSDLLRAWRQETPRPDQLPSHESLATLLEQHLPIAVLTILREAASGAEQRGSALYIVGGVVRDLLLDRPIGDLDLVVEGDAIAVANDLAIAHAGYLRSHAQFGTATVTLREPALTLDFVTARTEFYEQPSALPQIQPSSLRHDLHRRDFTINTLAVCLSPSRYGWLYDFYGGQRDLRRGLVRVLHNLSFIDDPTRLLRAVRLASRLGFVIEPRTRALIDDAIEQDVLSRTTPARITDELRLLLREPLPERAVTLLAELTLLQALHPSLRWGEDLAARFVAAREAHWPDVDLTDLYLGVLVYGLTPAEREQLSVRYQTTGMQGRLLREIGAVQVLSPQLAAPALTNSLLDRMLHSFSGAALRIAQLMEDESVAEAIRRYLEQLRPMNTILSGRDLLRLGLKPGPHIGMLLAGLRAARLNGLVQSEEEERAWIQQQLESGFSS